MMNSIVSRTIRHPLNVLGKFWVLLAINYVLTRVIVDIICTLLTWSTFLENFTSWSAFHILKNFLLVIFDRVWIHDANTCLRPLIIYSLWVTLLELGLIWSWFCPLLLNSNDVIRIDLPIHSQYWLVGHVFCKVLSTHILHLKLVFMDRFLTTMLVLRKHNRNKHVIHRGFAIALSTVQQTIVEALILGSHLNSSLNIIITFI